MSYAAFCQDHEMRLLIIVELLFIFFRLLWLFLSDMFGVFRFWVKKQKDDRFKKH